MTASFSSNELAAVLGRGAWFRSAPTMMQAQLIGAGRIERLPAGQRLFTRGDPDDGLYCVLDGLVRIGSTIWTRQTAISRPPCYGTTAAVEATRGASY